MVARTGVPVTTVAARAALGLAHLLARLSLLGPILGLGAVQRLGDQRVGEHELGFRHVGDRQQKLARLIGLAVLAAAARGFA